MLLEAVLPRRADCIVYKLLLVLSRRTLRFFPAGGILDDSKTGDGAVMVDV
jgi:hypothetical protein